MAITFKQLASLPILKDFYKLTWRLFGIYAIALASPDFSDGGLVNGRKTFNPFCTALRKQKRGDACCRDCDRTHQALFLTKCQPLSYRCHAGLREFIIPIKLGGELIAAMQCGQLLDRRPTQADWQHTRKALESHGIVTQGLGRLYRQIHVITPPRQKDLVTLLELIGNHVANALHQELQVLESRAGQVVEQAQRFIEEHFSEPLRIEDIAGAASVSERTLLRMFQLHLGKTVLDVLTQTRIRKACEQLRQSDRTCAAIAYDCGFGSIPQFNRIFRKRMRMTPSSWRKKAFAKKR